jgi:hypothetical protein
MAQNAPRTPDERWRILLERMGVPRHPRVYVLGTFARHVTFYSQQVRALNLVDALCGMGRVAEGSSVAVVGAGLAGLTAAAAALRRGLHVHLVEKRGDPRLSPGLMPLQGGCEERWIDPFVYDWPTPDDLPAEDAPAAGLPLLSWTANRAGAVREEVLARFREEAEPADGSRPRISYHSHTVTGADIQRAEDGRLLLHLGDGAPVTVDALVLAVGFGVEENEGSWRYWSNDNLGGNEAEGKTYLVTGMGDGGLTDVMRLCIAEFKHRDVLRAFGNARDVGKRLQEAVGAAHTDLVEAFMRAAGQIEPHPDVPLLLRQTTTVYLTGSPGRLFGPSSTASILNRLIVAWLLRKHRFKLVDARVGQATGGRGRRRVTFLEWDIDRECPQPRTWAFRDGALEEEEEPLPEHFGDVIIRHGPGVMYPGETRRRRPVETDFPEIWADSQANRTWWESMPHWEDWTRHPAWEDGVFDDPPPLDPPFGDAPLYVVVENSATTRGFVGQAVADLLDRAYHHGRAQSAVVPVRVDAAGAFDSPQALGRVVRMLCRADVAVFDVTPLACGSSSGNDEPAPVFTPEVMLLLGIRSVARRSLTIVTSRFHECDSPEPAPENAPFQVPRLPFLMHDVTVLGWRDPIAFVERLQRAMDEGRERARRLGPVYRDLPAYDEVRRIGPEPEDFREQGPETAVLFLTPFKDSYRDQQGRWLHQQADVVFTGQRMYIVQSPSPERTAAKLYAAIRRTQVCIVDWTSRSPNVFFEMGVRLAVSPRGPVTVIHHSDRWVTDPRGIYRLFRPTPYNSEALHPDPPLRRRLRHLKAMLKDGKDDARSEENALVSPDFVYRQMEAALAPETEDWDVPVWQELANAAQQLIGREPDQVPEFRGLFGDNASYRRHAEESARDRLLAAWYFLDSRHGLGRSVAEGTAVVHRGEEPWKEWFRIGSILERELCQDARPDYQEIGTAIAQTLLFAARLARKAKA